MTSNQPPPRLKLPPGYGGDKDPRNKTRESRHVGRVIGKTLLYCSIGLGILYASNKGSEGAKEDVRKLIDYVSEFDARLGEDHSFKCSPPEGVSDSAKNRIADGSDFYAYDPRVPLKVDQWVFGAAQALPKKPFRFSYRIGGKVADFSKNNGCVAFVPFENGSSAKDILGLEAAGRLVALACPSGRPMVLALGSNSPIQRKQVKDALKNSIEVPGLLWLPNEVAEKCFTPQQLSANSSVAIPIMPIGGSYTRNGHRILEASNNLWQPSLAERR